MIQLISYQELWPIGLMSPFNISFHTKTIV